MIVQRSDHRVTRPGTFVRVPRITGVVIIDLTDLDPRALILETDGIARRRIFALAGAPAGADVIIRPGKLWPTELLFMDSGIEHMGSVVVESADPTQIRRWTQCLREVIFG